MLRGWLALCVLLCSSPAWTQRTLPNDMDVAVLKKVELPYLTLSRGGFSWTRLFTLGLVDGNSAKLQVTRFVKIRDEKDRFLVLGRLTRQEGRVVAFRRDDAGIVREIWILDEGEAEAFARQAEQE